MVHSISNQPMNCMTTSDFDQTRWEYSLGLLLYIKFFFGTNLIFLTPLKLGLKILALFREVIFENFELLYPDNLLSHKKVNKTWNASHELYFLIIQEKKRIFLKITAKRPFLGFLLNPKNKKYISSDSNKIFTAAASYMSEDM